MIKWVHLNKPQELGVAYIYMYVTLSNHGIYDMFLGCTILWFPGYTMLHVALQNIHGEAPSVQYLSVILDATIKTFGLDPLRLVKGLQRDFLVKE